MNIYCFSTLSFAKLQFKSVINKAFHKHGVASFTDAWIETSLSPAICDTIFVASFTDAWIETGILRTCFRMRCVASFTDAWIETLTPLDLLYANWSHLLQMRGLKLVRSNSLIAFRRSHLLQMRGLKLGQIHFDCTAQLSHLLQMRGLKLTIKNKRIITSVASFTDAWIETGAYQHL